MSLLHPASYPCADIDQAIQAVLLGLAFVTLVLRGWARVLSQQSLWILTDVLAWAGWVFTLGWFICSTMALQILIDNPAKTEELIVESEEYLKVQQTETTG